jgi:hypothetical protein
LYFERRDAEWWLAAKSSRSISPPKLPGSGLSVMPSRFAQVLVRSKRYLKGTAGAQKTSDIDAWQRVSLPWTPYLFGLRLDQRVALTGCDCILMEPGPGTNDGIPERVGLDTSESLGALRTVRGAVALFVCRRTDDPVGKCSNFSYGRPLVQRHAACGTAAGPRSTKWRGSRTGSQAVMT